jgi:hypothetical protein
MVSGDQKPGGARTALRSWGCVGIRARASCALDQTRLALASLLITLYLHTHIPPLRVV